MYARSRAGRSCGAGRSAADGADHSTDELRRTRVDPGHDCAGSEQPRPGFVAPGAATIPDPPLTSRIWQSACHDAELPVVIEPSENPGSGGMTILSDVRFAIRGLRRTPLFTAAAVVSLTLGIATCTIVFSLVNAAMLRPPPFDEAGRLT